MAPAASAWLQHVLELSWAASASIIQSAGWCADPSMKVIMYLLAGWLVCINASICSRGHVWLVVHHANLVLTHTKQCLSINIGPFLKPRVSKSTRIHWRTRKCGQITGQINGIDHNNQSKIQAELHILAPAAFAWLQHVLELSWPASASIIQSGGVQINP